MVAFSIMFGVGPQAVDAKCYGLPDPPRSNDGEHYFVGEQQDLTALDAVSALGKNYDPWVTNAVNPKGYSPHNMWSMAFTMMSGLGEWAQAGWIEKIGDERYTFSEYSDPNSAGSWRHYYPAFSEGTSTVYRVDTDGTYVYYRAGPPSSQGLPPPLFDMTILFFPPARADVVSEISSFTHQIAGGYQSPYRMTWDAAYIHNPGGWYNFNGAVVNYNWNEFGWQDRTPHPVYGGGSFYSWDKRCSW